MRLSIGVLMPLPLNGMGVGYTCSSLIAGMARENVHAEVVTSRCRLSLPSVEVVEVLPKWARRAPYGWVRNMAARRLEQHFLDRVASWPSHARAAWLWPGASLETIAGLRRRGATVIREQFNCFTGVAKVILDDAYRSIGAEPAHAISDAIVEAERRVLDAVDHVFCPGPNVERSLAESGVDLGKLLPASYGWDPSRLSTTRRGLPPAAGMTLLFVGSICVRKGAHLLLDSWARSGVKGRLVLVGEMEPTIREKCAHLLARDDVIVLDYSREIGPLYRCADAFVFPTLEEGSPLVAYEACGAGLPVVTTRMGAGALVRPRREGLVVDAYDARGWISAIRELAEDGVLRRRLACGARRRAADFTWPAVAQRRLAQIEGLFADETPRPVLDEALRA
ncbi:hypothetical protein CCR94_18040 [Rhodoblastus sphagnicola]|uniref:Glycosyl transferase family 1 domain-containing protein n=1 Tax=Rhodoblastus sphagnicola TaxID=333368 RepID=A0A2S6N184_9HYPH|nr:glycosyltransferase family 4 protein [Rhodoblastus sphagnicola]MBB4200384.1 glycosyltransferase involved in cell wall biosynthesis [Rhodoblastus sphagnicola]PPQ28377.1 hypothetical protein CCR94_18040 [Rhodoblastus sphagnicola]